jgi:hypothetical protein
MTKRKNDFINPKFLWKKMSKNVGITGGGILKITESFSLRKIDPKVIARKFFQGDYQNRGLPDTKIRGSVSVVKIGKEIGNDKNSEVFSYKDKNNNNQIIYTTNHALYKYVMENTKDQNIKENPPILKCKYCKRGGMKRPIGLPIKMEKKSEKKDDITFHVVDSFCDFGCAFSYLKRRTGTHRLYRGTLFANAEQLLHIFYYRVFPDRVGESILEKPEWDLLRDNGGPLTNEEFDANASTYIPVPSIILQPAKQQYVKMNI